VEVAVSQRPLDLQNLVRDLPSGPFRELKQLLADLYAAAACPTLDTIAAWITNDDELPGAPSRDTIRRRLTAATRPARGEDVVAIATVLARAGERDEQDAAAWARRWWESAGQPPHHATPTDTQPGAMAVGVGIAEALAAGPIAYEVHPVITLEGAPDPVPAAEQEVMPTYVERDHDRRLRAVADAAAAGTSQIVVLVGGSSTGKTRACWEALHRLPAGWRLWNPLTPAELLDALTSPSQTGRSGPGVAPRTAVWLNELQRYLSCQWGYLSGRGRVAGPAA
jgi:hypothetical protein